MKKIKFSCIFIGIVLLAAALSLILFNVHQDKQAKQQSCKVLSVLNDQIIKESSEDEHVNYITTVAQEDLFAEYRNKSTTEKSVEIDGDTYIGVITIPQIDIELPVMDHWSEAGLKKSPCRYKGSCLTGDMIIAAHNYSSHFGKINNLEMNSEIFFTDAEGKRYQYEINSIEVINGIDIDKMEYGSDDEWDLTLFTCTLDGKSRVTIRAVERGQNEL